MENYPPTENGTAVGAILSEPSIRVELTHNPLNTLIIMQHVRSPLAGATVLFAGRRTTRNSFENKPVKELQYSAYVSLAIQTMLKVAREVKRKYHLTSVSMVHRLGVVPIAEESILIAVSAPHRGEAWKGGEELLELCKDKVEVWKLEEFGGEDGGVWKANRDGAKGEPM